MNRLWAPWRKEYITMKKSKGCIFCACKAKRPDKKKFMLKRTAHSFSMLNRYPYNNGHVMIAPVRHVKSPELLTKDELADLWRLVNYTKKKIDTFLKPDGFNIGLNIGKIAGAGFPRHAHVHVVPRWEGDTNFMPVIADTKIVSYSLDEMWKVLKG
ncbi:MAG: HIT domain-containing protein [Candidatus Omnitrophica bacterium]|nr:HIT domain-containing protein [Candidatus Omnitrophota bacterium]